MERFHPFLILYPFLLFPLLLFHSLDQLALIVLLQFGLSLLPLHFFLHLLALLFVHLHLLFDGCLVLYLPLKFFLPVLQILHEVLSLFGPGMIDAIKILFKMLILKRIDLVPQLFLQSLLLKLLP